MATVHIPSNQAARNAERAEVKKGEALRKQDIQQHIDKIEARKKELIKESRELLKAGKQDSPEYEALVEQHRFLRGKQRFFEDSQADVEDMDSSALKDRARMEKPSDALDRLRKETE